VVVSDRKKLPRLPIQERCQKKIFFKAFGGLFYLTAFFVFPARPPTEVSCAFSAAFYLSLSLLPYILGPGNRRVQSADFCLGYEGSTQSHLTVLSLSLSLTLARSPQTGPQNCRRKIGQVGLSREQQPRRLTLAAAAATAAVALALCNQCVNISTCVASEYGVLDVVSTCMERNTSASPLFPPAAAA
jgi:hypothetical protein